MRIFVFFARFIIIFTRTPNHAAAKSARCIITSVARDRPRGAANGEAADPAAAIDVLEPPACLPEPPGISALVSAPRLTSSAWTSASVRGWGAGADGSRSPA